MDPGLVLQEKSNDVLLKVKCQGFSWRMPAHSLLLVNKSSVFQEMMDDRAEDERPALVTLVGVQPESVVALLNYIYDGTFPPDVTADLLIASQRFRLDGLKDNLEGRIVSDVSVEQACDILEELQERQSQQLNCPMKGACRRVLEAHALTVFGSDLVLRLGRESLTGLVASDCLNVPDEACVFWGVWRWGRMQSSKYERSLEDKDVRSYIDDLLKLIRFCSLKCEDGIPPVAKQSFDRCKKRRSVYACPSDILKHSITLRPCPSFEDILPSKTSGNSPVCIQMSVEKDVMLVGVYLEMCSVESRAANNKETFLRVFREGDHTELRRAEICWCETSPRRLSSRADPECRLEAEVTLLEPLFLTPGNIYSIQLSGDCFDKFCFVWSSLGKRRVKVGNTFVNFHGEGVTSLREMYLIPDVCVTWGPRGPSV